MIWLCKNPAGGTKTLKKLFIDKKIPAHQRERIPVIADDEGVILVVGIGSDQGRLESPNWELLIEKQETLNAEK